jgi:hypothetical protein
VDFDAPEYIDIDLHSAARRQRMGRWLRLGRLLWFELSWSYVHAIRVLGILYLPEQNQPTNHAVSGDKAESLPK